MQAQGVQWEAAAYDNISHNEHMRKKGDTQEI